jgi:hypothetical protein
MSDADAPRPSGAQSRSTASAEITRRILAREAAASTDRNPDSAAVAMQRAWGRVTDALRHSMGEAGADALVSRALARTQATHPVLKALLRPGSAAIHLDSIAANTGSADAKEVSAAIEALIGALVDILARLIGEDMAIRVIYGYDPETQARGGAGEP